MATTLTKPGEQTRARYPDAEGYVERDGVRVFYEVYGSGEPTVLLLPTWSIIHSRFWKLQIPYLARHCRVVTFDGRGNGRSDRPEEPAAYDEREFLNRIHFFHVFVPFFDCVGRPLIGAKPRRFLSVHSWSV